MNVLVLGDGLLGTEITKQTGWDFVSRKKHGFDLTQPKTYENFLRKKAPNQTYDVILNCIAHTDTYSPEREHHWNVNYKAVADLVDFCNSNKIKLVHVSTDYVYSNSNHPASETDVPVHGANWYGYTKLLGDAHVQLKSNQYLILRATHKPKPFPYPKAWSDQVGNFDYVDKIAALMIAAIKKNATGVLNVGTETKSMLDLALQTKTETTAIPRPAHAPADVSMSIDKLKSLLS